MAPVNEAARLLDTAMALCTAPKTLTLEIRGRERERGERKKMASLSNMLILVIGLLGLYGTVRSDPDTSVTLILCNGGGYTKGDPFATSLTYVVEDLEAKTPKRKGYNYYNISPYPNSFAYGYASCSQNLTSKDCSTCLSSAKTAMFGTCDNRIGARAVLHDCQIRYEQYPFDD